MKKADISTDYSTDYTFKSSQIMAKLAICMDVEASERNAMQNENAYFDATHTRVHSFKSFGLWTYHPAMRRTVRLASMDLRSEKSTDIATFFILFNEVLTKVTGRKDYKFTPICFACNEGGANYKAIAMVYGADYCKEQVVGCQWHFLDDANKKSRVLPMHLREKFNKVCKQMGHSCTIVSKFTLLKGQLEEVPKLHPEITSWVEWWHARHSHIFTPFRGVGLPGVNLI